LNPSLFPHSLAWQVGQADQLFQYQSQSIGSGGGGLGGGGLGGGGLGGGLGGTAHLKSSRSYIFHVVPPFMTSPWSSALVKGQESWPYESGLTPTSIVLWAQYESSTAGLTQESGNLLPYK
jgi:hypothetical protein